MMSWNRLRVVSVMVCMIIALAVAAGCGQASVKEDGSGSNGSGASAGASSSNGASSGAVQAEDKGTMVYEAANGKIEVPKQPKRVLVLGDSYYGYLLALGIQPIGVTDHVKSNPYFAGYVNVPELGDGKSTEKVLELQPDLIIVFQSDDGSIDQLSKIAPTVAIAYGKLPLREQLLEFGKLTGREKQAADWIAKWDQKIKDAEPKVKAAVGDQTVSILQPYAKGIYAFGHNYGRGGEILYGEFKLKAPSPIQKDAIDNGKGWASLSLEVLPEYAGDFIFTSPWTGDQGDPDAVYGSTIWKNLPAVKNNRVFELNKDAAYFNDPVSMEKHLDFIVQKLTGGR